MAVSFKSKTFGAVLIVVGIALMGMSYYIKKEVAEGEGRISSAERSVDTTNRIFGGSVVGKAVTSPISKKIREGKETAAYYAKVGNVLMIAGIACLVLGIGINVNARRR